ncbi:MAG: phosphatidylinositol mannoside acyltransferase [Nitrospiraceae bacterium]|nr:phosphatidylinositol mannoside acyltransferase [Nitrospiraceae bacterium]
MPIDTISRLRAKTAYLGYVGASRAASLVPFDLGPLVGLVAGGVAYVSSPKRRSVVRRNLEPVVDGPSSRLEPVVQRAFASYAQYWFEAFKIGYGSRSSFVARGRAEGLEHLDEALAGGKGAIVVAPHLGNWDFAAAWVDHRRYKVTAVAERLEPPELFRWFVNRRAEFGVTVVPHDDDPMPKLVAALRRNEVVALVADRSIGAASVEVDFFGKAVELPMGPAILALRTGASLLPTAAYFEPRGGHLLRILPALEVGPRGSLRDDAKRLTQQIACSFESLIRQAPEQWHVFQPLF